MKNDAENDAKKKVLHDIHNTMNKSYEAKNFENVAFSVSAYHLNEDEKKLRKNEKEILFLSLHRFIMWLGKGCLQLTMERKNSGLKKK